MLAAVEAEPASPVLAALAAVEAEPASPVLAALAASTAAPRTAGWVGCGSQSRRERNQGVMRWRFNSKS